MYIDGYRALTAIYIPRYVSTSIGSMFTHTGINKHCV